MLLFEGKKKPHIKKPLNAFMLYMKEMRPKVTETITMVLKIVITAIKFVNRRKTLKVMSDDDEEESIR